VGAARSLLGAPHTAFASPSRPSTVPPPEIDAPDSTWTALDARSDDLVRQ
jgi:hypothetical protein